MVPSSISSFCVFLPIVFASKTQQNLQKHIWKQSRKSPRSLKHLDVFQPEDLRTLNNFMQMSHLPQPDSSFSVNRMIHFSLTRRLIFSELTTFPAGDFALEQQEPTNHQNKETGAR